MLNLPGRTHVAKDKDALFEDLAFRMIGLADQAISDRGVFHIALSGGSTPEPFYMSLCIDPRFRTMPWEKTHLWIVDERRVPEDNDKSNFKMMRESLIDQVPMPSRNVHPMPVMDDDPAGEYEASLREAFAGVDVPRIDFMLLGMGGDCHTASLFPHSAAVGVNDRWIVVNEGENVTPPDRVTMTYPMLNAARHIGVLIVGSSKAEALQRVSTQTTIGPDPVNLPITGVTPTDGDFVWYLDAEAAGE